MREQELQDHVESLVAGGDLIDHIHGWEAVQQVALHQRHHHDRLLLLDDLVLHRAADAALMVRDRLVDLVPVAKNDRSISLNRQEKLFVDLLYTSPATGTVVIVEIKRARASARETVTELLGYEQEIRNHLPFAARSDICFVVVSTDYSALLEHSLASLIVWHGLNILCVQVGEPYRLSVRLPVGWTSFGQDVIPSQHIDTMSLTFTPHDPDRKPTDIGILMNTALDMIARDADRSGITGFGLAWEDVRYLWESPRPAGLTVARVNPAGFLSSAKAAYFLDDGMRSPLHEHISDVGSNRGWAPSSPELEAASRYLSRHGTVEWHKSGTWQDLRRDARHRTPEATLDHHAIPIIANTWGLVGDYVRDLLGSPARMASTAGGFGDQVIETRGPEFVLDVIDRIAPDEKVILFGALWWSRLGFRLSRLWFYAEAHRVKSDFRTRDLLRPLMAWARADLQVPLRELQIAVSFAEIGERPPAIVLGWDPEGSPRERPDVIRALVRWIADQLIGDRSALHRTVFEAAFQTGQVADDGVFTIEPDIDLDAANTQAVMHVNGMLELAIALAPRRRGAYAGLTAHLAKAFGLDCDSATSPAHLLNLMRLIPAETLFDEYVAAVPAALDIAVAPLAFGTGGQGCVIPSESIAVIRQRVLQHRKQGRPAGIYITENDEYGVTVLDEEHVAMFRDLADEHVIVRYSYPHGSEYHSLTTWSQLTILPTSPGDS